MPSVLRRIIGLVIGLAGVAIAVAPVAAQEPVAEVRTWSGETLRLSQPSLEVFYTIPVKGEDAPPSDAAASTPPPMLFGSAQALAGALEKKPEPLSGQRQAESVTLQKGAVERRIPLLSVASLVFARRPVVSTLPPYFVATHFRYAATAVLLEPDRILTQSRLACCGRTLDRVASKLSFALRRPRPALDDTAPAIGRAGEVCQGRAP